MYHAFWSPDGEAVQYLASAGTRREAQALAEDLVSEPRDGTPYVYTPHVFTFGDSELRGEYRRELRRVREVERELAEEERRWKP